MNNQKHVHIRRKNRFLATVVLFGLLFATAVFNSPKNSVWAAGQTVTITAEADFNAGTVDANLDSATVSGQLTLYKTADVDTSKEDFISGHTPRADGLSLSSITENSGGEIVINQGGNYTSETSPALLSDWAYHSFLDGATNYLYVSTYSGISVLDLSTDTLVKTYSSATSPALADDYVYHSFVDSATNRLYASTYSGLSVIDLTTNSLVKTYNTASSPALPDDWAVHSFIETGTNYLYVSTHGGLAVIDLTEDELVKVYNSDSSPAISDNDMVWYSHLVTSTNSLTTSTRQLYASTHGGLYILDLDTDTLVKRYYLSSSPGIVSSYVYHSVLNPSNNYLYISASMGLSAVDLDTDTVVKNYTATTSPALTANGVEATYLDTVNNRLYIAADCGVSVLDLASDTVIAAYTDSSSPRLFFEGGEPLAILLSNNKLYISGSGLSVIDLDGNYNSQGVYVSQPQAISATATKAISWEDTKSSGQNVVFKTRTGDSDDFWIDNFDDDVADEFVGDYFEWGSTFAQAEESDGTLKISDPDPFSYSESNRVSYFWLDTGEAEGYFPPGSIVRAKIRINSDRILRFTDYMFEEDWWSDATMLANNTWIYPTFVAASNFSRIGFNIVWRADSWDNENDSVEIDWLSIEAPDASWGDWSESHTDSSGSLIATDLTGHDWLQYRAELTTDNVASTPLVESVSIYSYATSGTFISGVVDMGVARDSGSFAVNDLKPTGTDISYSFRSGETATPDDSWSGWQIITDTLPAYSRYAQVKAVFTTTDQSVTPILYDMTLTGGDVPGMVLPPVVYSAPSAPVDDFQIKINNGATTTDSRKVNLSLSGGVDATKMALSMNADFSDAVQENFVADKQWDLCSRVNGTLVDAVCPGGVYTVYARFYTAWGVASPIISQSITLTADQSMAIAPTDLDSEATPQIISPFPDVSLSEPADNSLNGPRALSATSFSIYLRFMSRGDEVRRLQMFLNQSPDTRLTDTGPGSPGKETAFFGPLTRQAVIKFQEKYTQEILAPWKLTKGTGYVGKTTLAKINELLGF